MANQTRPLKNNPLKSDKPKREFNESYGPMNANHSARISKLPFVIAISVGFILLLIGILTNNGIVGIISVAILIVTLIIFYEKIKGRKKKTVKIDNSMEKAPKKPMSSIDRLIIKNNELKKMKENLEKGMKKYL